MNPRLPRAIVPRHYRIKMSVDLDEATFVGTVGIDIDIETATEAIVCNAAELEVPWATITRLRADGGDRGHGAAGAAPAQSLDVVLDPEAERLTLTTRAGFASGPARLDIAFNGTLNDRLRGFYRSTYTDDAGRTRTIAATQFESTDARRAFPCWDEPAFKATFATTLVVDETMLAITNTAETHRRPAGVGRVEVHFAPTMVMSTYLVAFVVGPLDATEPIDVGGVPVRVVHRPGRSDLTAFALEAAAHALSWFADYYDLAYPSDKVDLVALPDFAFGAMENLGCVTFREVLLLVDPSTASPTELERVATVINHELAHMWFGDLVTMAWWEGIWLNEAFATFMELACTDAFRPDWKVWSTFDRARAAALTTDALAATRPIEYPVVTPADAEDMFDVLTYEKGAAVVRMLEQYLSPDTFRAGVRLYLRRHAYANTATTDLWDALEEASGQPVRSLMGGWIDQGGHPVVKAEAGDHGLVITARHFTLDPAAADGRAWVVPLRIRTGDTGGTAETRLLLDRPRRILTAPPGPVVTLNGGGTGFYRVELDAATRAAIASTGPGALSARERHGLIDDAWALTLTSAMTAPELLELILGGFTGERDLNVWQALTTALAGMRRILDDGADSKAGAGLGRLVTILSDEAVAAVGPGPGADDRTRELRATLLRLRGTVADDPATIETCRLRLDDPDPTLAAAALTVVAHHGDADDFARIRARFTEADDPQTEQRHLHALADFSDPELVATILEGTRDGTIRTQDGPYLIRRALTNRHAGLAAWAFVTTHWDELNRIFPSNSVSRMLEGITGLDRPDIAGQVRRFLADHPVPQGSKQIAQHLERLTVNVAFRTRETDRLSAAVLQR